MRIVTRGEWGHPGPLGPPMRLPASRLYVHHSVTDATDAPPHRVAQIGIERFGRSSYSYAVTPDGTVYEMQGVHIGAHTAGQNSSSLAAVLVGNYDQLQPTTAQVREIGALHRWAVGAGALLAGASLDAHRDAPGAATACPGRHGYAALTAMRVMAIPTDQEDDVLERGDSGDLVTRLQWRINHRYHKEGDPRAAGKNHGLPVTGVYDEETEAYVRDIQADIGDRKHPGKASAALQIYLHDVTFEHEVRP